MKTSIFAFATDLHDEGVDTVVQNVADRGGADGVTVASAYHHGRDIFPHNPARKVHFLEGGAVFFRPDLARYEGGRIQPHVSQLAEEADVFTTLRDATEQRGMQVHAWTVFLHNSTLAGRYPDCAVRNVFGDAYVTELCPANPEVRRYAVTLAGDLMRYRLDGVLAESLHYHPLEHGFHHERYFIDLGALGRFLLGLCFCEHCMRRAGDRGVDAGAVHDAARKAVAAVFEADPEDAGAELEREVIEDFAGGEMAGYLAMRADAVTTLAEDITEAVDGGGGRFTFMDLSGAVKGYATGRPTGEAAPTIAWRLGVDLEGLARACHGVEAIGYAAEVDRLRFDLGAYRDLVGDEASLSVALRPMAPDCDSAENLAAKLELARELGLERADFYHYGFMRLGTLDRIHDALNARKTGKMSR